MDDNQIMEGFAATEVHLTGPVTSTTPTPTAPTALLPFPATAPLFSSSTTQPPVVPVTTHEELRRRMYAAAASATKLSIQTAGREDVRSDQHQWNQPTYADSLQRGALRSDKTESPKRALSNGCGSSSPPTRFQEAKGCRQVEDGLLIRPTVTTCDTRGYP